MVSQEDIKEFILTHKKKIAVAAIVLILLIILTVISIDLFSGYLRKNIIGVEND